MIALIAGEEKTGKTTFALTFPKPMMYLEFDIGGFDRAIRRIKDSKQIKRRQFFIPINLLASRRQLASQGLKGFKELWFDFIETFDEACRGDYKTIVIDTWFQVYELVRLAVLQEKQENQLDQNGSLKKGEIKLRESLLQVEYAEPYARLRNILFYAKGTGKHLVLVTYDADKYEPQIDDSGRITEVRTGKKVPAGWKETEKHADIGFWLTREDEKITARISLPGIAPPDAVRLTLDNNYDALVSLLSTIGVEVR